MWKWSIPLIAVFLMVFSPVVAFGSSLSQTAARTTFVHNIVAFGSSLPQPGSCGPTDTTALVCVIPAGQSLWGAPSCGDPTDLVNILADQSNPELFAWDDNLSAQNQIVLMRASGPLSNTCPYPWLSYGFTDPSAISQIWAYYGWVCAEYIEYNGTPTVAQYSC